MLIDKNNKSPATPSLLKEINRLLILNKIREAGEISRAELSKKLGLSKPTVSALTAELINMSFLKEQELTENYYQTGRRPVMLQINSEIGGIVAVKLGVKYIKAAVYNIANTLICKIQHKIDLDKRNKDFLLIVQDLVDEVIKKSKIKKVLGLGFGIDGVVDIESGILISSPYHPYWNGLAIKSILEEKYQIPVYVDNGLNMAALGESFNYEGKVDNLIIISITEAITAGMVINGVLYRGHNNNVGEIGHIVVSEKKVKCNCGNEGCFAAMASDLAVVRLAAEALARHDKTLITEASLDSVLNAAAAGDLVAKQILEETGMYLGIGIAGLINLLNPKIVVIDGKLIRENDIVFEVALKNIRKRALPTSIKDIVIFPSTLRGDASLLGASLRILEYLFNSPEISKKGYKAR